MALQRISHVTLNCADLIERGVDQVPGTRGVVDHYAIEATELPETLARLKKAGLEFHENPMA